MNGFRRIKYVLAVLTVILPSHYMLGQQGLHWQKEGLAFFLNGQTLKANEKFEDSYNVSIREKDWKTAASSLFCQTLVALYDEDSVTAQKQLQKASAFLKFHLSSDSAFWSEYYYYTAHLYRIQGKKILSLDFFQQAAQTRTRAGLADSIVEKSWHNIGFLSQDIGRYDVAEPFYLKSISLSEKIYGPTDIGIATTYLNLGSLYTEMGNYSASKNVLEKAEEIYKKNPEAGSYLYVVYLNLVSLYQRMGELDKSLQYNKQALVILHSMPSANPVDLASTYNNMCAIFLTKGENDEFQLKPRLAFSNFDSAIHYGKIGLNLPEKKFKPWLCSNLGQIYARKGEPDNARNYFRKAISDQIDYTGETHFDLATYYIRYGQFLCDSLHLLQEAELNCSKAIILLENSLGKKHWKTGMAYSLMGDIYNQKNAFGTALKFYQKAVLAISDKDTLEDISFTPHIENLVHSSEALLIIKKKGYCLFRLYQKNQQQATLTASLKAYETAAGLINDLRRGFSSEESKIDLTASEGEIFDKLIEISWLLNLNDPGISSRSRMFTWMEKSKASVLLSSIRNNEALNMGGIPPEIISMENKLRREIAFYGEQLYEENKQLTPDRLKIGGWQQKLFQLKVQYDSLVYELEKHFPGYYSLKFNSTVLSLGACQQKLKPGETLIEYATTPGQLYSIFVSKDTVLISKTSTDQIFINNIQAFHHYLSSSSFSEDPEELYRKFAGTAFALYKILLSPYSNFIEDKKLIVIPDEALALIPFDVLLTDSAISIAKGFRGFPYVLKKSTLSNSYSATLRFSLNSSRSLWQSKLLAVAPNYENINHQNTPFENTRQAYLNALFPIPGAREEAQLAASFFRSTLLLDSLATEGRFKSLAEKYDILHLSMHTIIDNQDPMYSKLVFSAMHEQPEDGLLNTYEIYNLRLHCKMAVLTSCNTGIGQSAKGEGVMSLARAFVYAGCPSLIMSFWEVEDNSSLELMKYFYQELKKGVPKDEALRNAKLTYLEKADPLFSHPYFWSGIVMIGDNSPVLVNRKHMLIFGAMILILASGVFIYYRKSKKSRKEIKDS